MKILNQNKFAMLKMTLANLGVNTHNLANDKICSAAAIAGLETKGIFGLENQVQPEPTPEPTPEPVATPAANVSGLGELMDKVIAASVAAALDGHQAPLDENKILELIEANAKPSHKIITVKTPTTTVTLEGEILHETYEQCVREISVFPNQLFLFGESGSGKSYTAKQVAKGLDLPFFAMGAILVKYDILGNMTATSYNKSIVRQWLDSDSGLLLIDEIDASCPRALVTIMSMFDDSGSITFPDGETFKRNATTHPVIVTANTTGNGANHKYNGRAKLDSAFKARFILIDHGYCTELEDTFASAEVVDYVRRFRAALNDKGLEGSLVTPRHTKMLGERAHFSKLDFKLSLKTILKQGLTDSEYKSVTNSIGAF